MVCESCNEPVCDKKNMSKNYDDEDIIIKKEPLFDNEDNHKITDYDISDCKNEINFEGSKIESDYRSIEKSKESKHIETESDFRNIDNSKRIKTEPDCRSTEKLKDIDHEEYDYNDGADVSVKEEDLKFMEYDNKKNPNNDSISSEPKSPDICLPSAPCLSTSSFPSSPCKRRKKTIFDLAERCKHLEATSSTEDKFTSIGKTWAAMLRGLPPIKALHVENMINEVFYEVSLENLESNSIPPNPK